ncbi:Hypp2813 [Branchiostoma lanceolatum]|uniref:Hypp2813 protein n=2 Tax=Branchiostoma lanceolatum TaxID=7740 RepID=A0A8J9ZV92_BRALA|nr:Hypp2813 [Branchiostoma lanceolatum]
MADVPLIPALVEKFMACFNANDMKGLANLFTEDGKIMPPGSDTAHGREGVQHVLSSYRMALGVTTLKLKSEEVGPMGSDVMYDRGIYTSNSEDGTVADAGKYVLIFKKVGGVWFIYIDIFNKSKA